MIFREGEAHEGPSKGSDRLDHRQHKLRRICHLLMLSTSAEIDGGRIESSFCKQRLRLTKVPVPRPLWPVALLRGKANRQYELVKCQLHLKVEASKVG